MIPIFNEKNVRIKISVNADSISNWWFSAINEHISSSNTLLDITIEDQKYALNRMREGEVSACISSAESPLSGARSVFIGNLEYGIRRQYAQIMEKIIPALKKGLNEYN